MTDMPAETGTEPRPVPFISRVRLKNYKSIAECDVRLGPLTILVGPNGSGKSNFLDALAFLSRALRTTIDEAIDERGGIDVILRRVPKQSQSFTIEVESSLHELSDALYRFTVGHNGEILREECRIKYNDDWRGFTVYRGSVQSSVGGDGLDIGSDRLYLPITKRSGELAIPLRQMQFYNSMPKRCVGQSHLRRRPPWGLLENISATRYPIFRGAIATGSTRTSVPLFRISLALRRSLLADIRLLRCLPARLADAARQSNSDPERCPTVPFALPGSW